MRLDPLMTDASFMKEVGSRISRYRLDRNLTQAALAEEAGIALRTVQRIEGGSKGVHLAAFLRVCRVLGFLGNFEAMLPEPQLSPMQIIESEGNLRKRSRKTQEPKKTKQWAWGTAR